MDRTERMTEAAAPAASLERSYIDWPAILAGAVVAAAIGAVFDGFGMALGLSALSAEPGEGSFSFALILTGLWIVVTIVASFMAGGYIAGRMRRRVDAASAEEVTVRDGINGLVVWGVAMLASLMILANAVSTAATTAGSAIGQAAGGLAEGALAAASGLAGGDGADPVGYVNTTLLRAPEVSPASYSSERVAAETGAILMNVLRTGEIAEDERGFLASAVAARTGLSQEEAAARAEAAVAEAQRMRAEAEEAAIDAAEAARIGGVLTGFILAAAALVAAAAAYIGAVRGGRHRDEGRIFGGFAWRG